jgi:hypothetical protein
MEHFFAFVMAALKEVAAFIGRHFGTLFLLFTALVATMPRDTPTWRTFGGWLYQWVRHWLQLYTNMTGKAPAPASMQLEAAVEPEKEKKA